MSEDEYPKRYDTLKDIPDDEIGADFATVETAEGDYLVMTAEEYDRRTERGMEKHNSSE